MGRCELTTPTAETALMLPNDVPTPPATKSCFASLYPISERDLGVMAESGERCRSRL